MLTREDIEKWNPTTDVRAAVLALLEERDSWRRQAGVEATCVGTLSERAEKAEAEREEARREAKEAAEAALAKACEHWAKALGVLVPTVDGVMNFTNALAEHDAAVRRAALEMAAVWFEQKAPPCPYEMVPGRLRALAVAPGGDT